MRNRNIETAKLACFLNSLRPSLSRVVRRKNTERTKRKIGIAAASKAMILKIIVHSGSAVSPAGEQRWRMHDAGRVRDIEVWITSSKLAVRGHSGPMQQRRFGCAHSRCVPFFAISWEQEQAAGLDLSSLGLSSPPWSTLSSAGQMHRVVWSAVNWTAMRTLVDYRACS